MTELKLPLSKKEQFKVGELITLYGCIVDADGELFAYGGTNEIIALIIRVVNCHKRARVMLLNVLEVAESDEGLAERIDAVASMMRWSPDVPPESREIVFADMIAAYRESIERKQQPQR